MRKWLLLLSVCAAGALFGCGQKPKEISDTLPANQTTETTAATTVTSEETTTGETSEETARTTTRKVSDTSVSTAATQTAAQTAGANAENYTFTMPVLQTPDAKGGEGGEEHAEEPHPDYFTYRFAADNVSMRLAGGNYQTLFYDFSEAVGRDAETAYGLEDFDFDGYPDLVVPTRFDDGETWTVFFWAAGQLKFSETPTVLENPVRDESSQTIRTLRRESDGKIMLEMWKLPPGEIAPEGGGAYFKTETDCADFAALTLQTPDGTQNFETPEALEVALLQRYRGG